MYIRKIVNLRIILVIFISTFTGDLVNSQTIPTNSKCFNISNSIGYSFSKSKPTFYVSFSKMINNKMGIGVKVGVLNYSEKIKDEVFSIISADYPNLESGFYTINFGAVPVSELTYISSMQGTYLVEENISANFNIGIKMFTSNKYSTMAFFSKPSNNSPPITEDEISLNYSSIVDSKNVIRMYYSAGLDYHFGQFNLGVFGDNIYSVGVNAGVSF